MATSLIKHIIKGVKSKTVFYTMTNFRFDSSDNKLKWDSFKFYTPEGDETNDSFKCFTVPAGEILLTRDSELDKSVMLVFKVTDKDGEWTEILEGSNSLGLTIGLEGDIVAMGFIPTDTEIDIQIDYKEVS